MENHIIVALIQPKICGDWGRTPKTKFFKKFSKK